MSRFFILCLLCFPLIHAADEPPELSPAAKRAVAQFERQKERAQAEYDAAIAKATDDLLEALEREKTRVTKRGDLEGALAIDTIIKEHSTKDFMGEGRPNAAALVKTEEKTFPFKTGGLAFSNRQYTWSDVPEEFDGFSITRPSGDGASAISFDVVREGPIFLAKRGAAPDGWEPTGLSITCGGKGNAFSIYKKIHQPGTVTMSPQDRGDFLFLLIPLAK